MIFMVGKRHRLRNHPIDAGVHRIGGERRTVTENLVISKKVSEIGGNATGPLRENESHGSMIPKRSAF
jgi:hypothetical protein